MATASSTLTATVTHDHSYAAQYIVPMSPAAPSTPATPATPATPGLHVTPDPPPTIRKGLSKGKMCAAAGCNNYELTHRHLQFCRFPREKYRYGSFQQLL